jgi:hypothetical protein
LRHGQAGAHATDRARTLGGLTSHIFSFTDPHPYQAAIRAANVEILPTTKGNFHADLMHIDLHRLWLQRGRESLPHTLLKMVRGD